MRAILAAALVLAASAAQAQQERTFSLPTTATAYEQAKVLQAVNEWNVALKGAARLVLLDRGSPAEWQIDFDTSRMVDMRENACEAHQLVRRIHCNPRAFVSRPDRPVPCNFAATISHEIAHALGVLEHHGGLLRERCHTHEHPVDEATARAALNALNGVKQ
ncbi:MAG: hypothetical protein KGS44_13210 [Alphaproteobacteria bacterium]|nr:hypothetical protein [Alphaproteobacteria bacterium]